MHFGNVDEKKKVHTQSKERITPVRFNSNGFAEFRGSRARRVFAMRKKWHWATGGKKAKNEQSPRCSEPQTTRFISLRRCSLIGAIQENKKRNHSEAICRDIFVTGFFHLYKDREKRIWKKGSLFRNLFFFLFLAYSCEWGKKQSLSKIRYFYTDIEKHWRELAWVFSMIYFWTWQ